MINAAPVYRSHLVNAGSLKLEGLSFGLVIKIREQNAIGVD